eukprot:Em0005g730a
MTTNCTKAPALGLPLGAFVCCSDAQKEPFTFLVQITTSSVTTLPTTFTFVHQCQSNASQWLKQMEASIVAAISDMKETISAKLEALALTPTSSWDLVVCLQDLARKWTKEKTDMEELLDLVVLEQFLNTLTAELKVLAATGTHVERLLHGREKKLTCKGMVEQLLLWRTLFWIRNAQEQWLRSGTRIALKRQKRNKSEASPKCLDLPGQALDEVFEQTRSEDSKEWIPFSQKSENVQSSKKRIMLRQNTFNEMNFIVGDRGVKSWNN